MNHAFDWPFDIVNVDYWYFVQNHDLNGIDCVQDAREQQAIGVMLRLRKEGLSLRQIASQLAELGFVGRTGKTLARSTVRVALIRCAERRG